MKSLSRTAFALLAAALLVACGASSATDGPPAPAPEPVAAPAAPAPASASKIETASFQSPALGVEKQYVVYLPAGYESSPDRRYPVLYMLHGLGGSETNWRDIGIADAADQVGIEAIIVMPDGDDGFYVNWASEVDYDSCLAGNRPFGKAADMKTYCVKQANYGDYIAVDLVGHIDATYRTIPDRKARAIGGLSMGGYGSLYHAAANHQLFGAVASHAGVASILYAGPFPYRKGSAILLDDPKPMIAGAGAFGALFERVWGTDIATWRSHDPATLLAGLDDGRLAIYFDCGTADEFRLQNANQYLAEALTEAGVSHSFHLIDGGRHNGAYWSSRVDDSLLFVKQFFAR